MTDPLPPSNDSFGSDENVRVLVLDWILNVKKRPSMTVHKSSELLPGRTNIIGTIDIFDN